MYLAGVDIKPAEGYVLLKFVDDDDDEGGLGSSGPSNGAYGMPSEPVPYEGCLAIVVGVGDKVKGIKKGQTVVTRPYARDGMKVGDDLVLCEA